jgi:ferredoxin
VRSAVTTDGPRLRIDATACDGIGICSHLAPSVVSVDSWGYPVLAHEGLRGSSLAQAERAVAGCPRKALFLDR